MGSKLALITTLFWFPQAIIQLLAWIYWLQVKEYRWDRFKLLFFSENGRENLFVPLIFVKFIVLGLFVISGMQIRFVLLFYFLVDSVFVFRVLRKGLRSPIFTQRAQVITILSLFFATLAVFGASAVKIQYPLASIVWGEIGLVIFPLAGVLVTSLRAMSVKRKEIARARGRIKKINPTVIGVTGSYGKTTTKEFIAHLLSQKYKTAKTTGSENTELGIARKTIDFVKKGVRFYVVEMGAYKKGEIQALTHIVNPKVGVITGIEPQHLSLFGSLNNIKETKFELIESLPPDGTAVFNLSNRYCRELAEKAKRLYPKLKVVGYFQAKKDQARTQVKIESRIVADDINGVIFEVKEGKIKKRLFAPVHGTYFIENLIGAILVARMFGVTWAQISKGCQALELPEKTMQVTRLKNGTVVIDDSYNSTPKGFESALEYLSGFKKEKKILLTSGIIELGGLSDRIHKHLAKRISGLDIDKVFLTNKDFFASFRRGLGKRNTILQLISKPNGLDTLKDALTPKSAVLIEGRIPEYIKKIIFQP